MKTGLNPIVGDDTDVLILGTFPGVKSLAAGEYYAHQRNIFWDMMDEVCGAGRQHTYEERCKLLKANRIAVWDVIYACDRDGSADGRIRKHVVNDFATFFSKHPCRTIFFNGNMASRLFTKYLDPDRFNIRNLIVLPSTSPANAGITREEKRRRWRNIAEYIKGAEPMTSSLPGLTTWNCFTILCFSLLLSVPFSRTEVAKKMGLES